MPAAIAIPAIVGAAGAATSLVGARMASGASRDAASTQSAAGDRALQLQQQQYQQARQDFAPYQQQGSNAVNQLGQMAAAPRQSFNPNAPMGLPQSSQGMQPGAPPMGQPQQMGQLGMPPQTMQQAGQQGGQTVLLRAPNGQTKEVPAAQADALIAKGAVRVR